MLASALFRGCRAAISRVSAAPLLRGARAMATAPEMTIRDALNSAIDEEMERDPTVFVIGACGRRIGGL